MQALIITGQEFTNWRDVSRGSRRTMVEVTLDRDWAIAFLGQVGGYMPGVLGDGTPVEWNVVSVNPASSGEYSALLISEAPINERYL